MVLYKKTAINSLRYIKVVFCKVFYRLFSHVYVFLYLKLFGGEGEGQFNG